MVMQTFWLLICEIGLYLNFLGLSLAKLQNIIKWAEKHVSSLFRHWHK